jgi:branched-subunit amino acid transport protein
LTPGFLAALILASAGTQALRLVFLGRKDTAKAPAFLGKAMDYVPASILSALVFQEFFLGGGPLRPRIAAGVVALALALRPGRDVVTILGGLLAYWLVQNFF